jgi:hypothetical protein
MATEWIVLCAVASLIALSGIMSVATGLLIATYALGVWTYAHVYQHFLAQEQIRSAKRVADLVNHQRITEQRLEGLKRKVISQYHPLDAEKQRVVDESLEEILSGTARGRR